MTVRALFEALEESCHERTIYRDLEQLAAAGFPIVDVGGRWRSLQAGEGGWSVPVVPTELLMLALSEDVFAHLRGTWLADPLHALRQKLFAMMTPKGREFFERLRTFSIASISAPGDFRGQQEILAEVFKADNERRVLEMDYRKPGAEPSRRTVEPYVVWFHEGTVRFLARCRDRDDIRQFVIQRIEHLEVTAETFEPRDDFDAADYIRASFGVFHGDPHEVVIDFSPEVAHLIAERRYHHTQQITPLDGGGLRLEMKAAGLREIAGWIAGFGRHALPRAPNALVDRVRALHTEGLAQLDH